MAHYDCSRCGHRMGIGPGYCKACSSKEELEEVNNWERNYVRNIAFKNALEFLNIPCCIVKGKVHIPEHEREKALNVIRRELLGETN